MFEAFETFLVAAATVSGSFLIPWKSSSETFFASDTLITVKIIARVKNIFKILRRLFELWINLKPIIFSYRSRCYRSIFTHSSHILRSKKFQNLLSLQVHKIWCFNFLFAVNGNKLSDFIILLWYSHCIIFTDFLTFPALYPAPRTFFFFSFFRFGVRFLLKLLLARLQKASFELCNQGHGSWVGNLRSLKYITGRGN